MELYIETENGVNKNHPAFEDNLIQAFGVVPTYWEPFTRVECPTPTVYQILESDEPVYAKVDGVWIDVWSVREMTTEEKTAKQQATIATFNSREQASNWAAWALDETTCTMQPPIPPPEFVKGVNIRWCGADNNWKNTPVRREGEYNFDFLAWKWVAV